MATNGGRTGPAYQALRNWVITNHTNCHICGKPVDKTLNGRHKWGPTLDHIIPISKGGPMLDRANARLAHRYCNGSKHDDILPPATNPSPSRDWLPA